MPQALISDDIWLSVIQSQGAGGSHSRTLCPKMHEVLDGRSILLGQGGVGEGEMEHVSLSLGPLHSYKKLSTAVQQRAD